MTRDGQYAAPGPAAQAGRFAITRGACGVRRRRARHPEVPFRLPPTRDGAPRALFYLPQLAAVARSDSGARDIALCTWCMFTCNNALGALYCGWVLGERAMALSFAASLVGCIAMIALTLARRAAYAADRGRRLGGRPPRRAA